MSKVKLLITGFEPFKHHKVNTSWQAAKHVGDIFDSVLAMELPVDYIPAHDELVEVLKQYQPESCLCMGLAEGIEFRFERKARKPEQLSYLTGEALHNSVWPFEQMENALNQAESSWRYSDDCGQYVCESTLWTLLQYQYEHNCLNHAAFLHVPSASDEYPIERINNNIEQIVRQYLKT